MKEIAMSEQTSYWFTPTHEWVRVQGDSLAVTIGLSSVGVQLLGGVVRVELPEVGRSVESGEELLLLETDKAALGIASPLAGRVTQVNEALLNSPDLLEGSPYDAGWMVELLAEDLAGQLRKLIPQARYFEEMNIRDF
jgi:glycine cleavage system H protein